MATTSYRSEQELGFIADDFETPLGSLALDINDLNDAKTVHSITRENETESYAYHARNGHLGANEVVGTVITSAENFGFLEFNNKVAHFPRTTGIEHADGNTYTYLKAYIKEYGTHAMYLDPCQEGLDVQQITTRTDLLPWFYSEVPASKTRGTPKAGQAVALTFKHGLTMGRQIGGRWKDKIVRDGSTAFLGKRCRDAFRTAKNNPKSQTPVWSKAQGPEKVRAAKLADKLCRKMEGFSAGPIADVRVGGSEAGIRPGGTTKWNAKGHVPKRGGDYDSVIARAAASGDDPLAEEYNQIGIARVEDRGGSQAIWDRIYELERDGLIEDGDIFYQTLVAGLMTMAKQESNLNPASMGDRPGPGDRKGIDVVMKGGNTVNYRSFGY